MAEIKKINTVKIAEKIVTKASEAITSAGEAITETIDIDGETISEAANTVNETDTKPATETIQSPHSINLLHDKIVGGLDNITEDWTKGLGVLPMGIYGTIKGVIEANPMTSASIHVTETLVEGSIASKTVSKIANKGFELINGVLLPEEWLNFGEEAFIRTEEDFSAVGKMIGNNFNVLRSTGARINVAINAVFAGIDAGKVFDYYTQKGEEGTAHIGEVIGRFTGETVGGAGGFALGMAGGTAASAAITGAICGSVVPGVGTAVGLVAGAVIGALGAVVLGDIGATAGSYIDGNNGEIVTL